MTTGGRARGGGRWIDVPPERFARWVSGFDVRHRITAAELTPYGAALAAADGALAECHVPFPPLRDPGAGFVPGERLKPEEAGALAAAVARHAGRDRCVGVMLVRLGGYAVGVFQGRRLLGSKVGSRFVQGRSAAGGWSQQRFARRRDKQAREAIEAAADAAARVLGPYAASLEAVVCGGDRRAVAALSGDPRLAAYVALTVDRFLNVPDPRRAVLEKSPDLFTAVRVRLHDVAAG